MRVSVYFNLHRKCFSIRAEEGPEKGRVVAHADRVILRDVKMVVGQAGNRKVRETGQKNVHAFMRGHLAALKGSITAAGERIIMGETEGCDELTAYIPEDMNRRFALAEQDGVRLTYDPYRDTSFVAAGLSRLPVHHAWTVCMGTDTGVHGVGVTA